MEWSAMKQILNWKDYDNLNVQYFYCLLKMANGNTSFEWPMSLTKQITNINIIKQLYELKTSIKLDQSGWHTGVPFLHFPPKSILPLSVCYLSVIKIHEIWLMIFPVNLWATFFFLIIIKLSQCMKMSKECTDDSKPQYYWTKET